MYGPKVGAGTAQGRYGFGRGPRPENDGMATSGSVDR
jgi:hypothetical protein